MGIFSRKTGPPPEERQRRWIGNAEGLPQAWPQVNYNDGVSTLDGFKLPAPFTYFPTATAAAEAAAGLLSRAIGCARVTASPLLRPAISYRLLSLTARSLLYRGEQAILLETDGGRVRLSATEHYWKDINTLWCDVPEPNGYRHLVDVSIDSVAIPHWATDFQQPWLGISPLQNLTSKLAAAVTGKLHLESQSKSGYLLPFTKSSGGTEMGAAFTRGAQGSIDKKLAEAGTGQVAGVATSSGMLGTSRSNIAGQNRFGFDPPPQLREIAEWAHTETLQACGVPPLLMSPLVESREAQRRFLTLTVQPLCDSIAAEISRVAESEVKLDAMVSRSPADTVSLARATASLVSGAKMLLEDALDETGLDESPGRADPNAMMGESNRYMNKGENLQ